MNHKFPDLKTERLILGQALWTDIPKIVEYAGAKRISDMTLNIPYPYAEKDAIWWINSANEGFKAKNQYTFAMRLKSNKDFVGGVGLKLDLRFNHAVLGYWIAEPFWKKGYTTEAVQAILQFGFETLDLNKIYATHLIENPASGRVMQKNGMIKEGELVEHYRKNGEYKSIYQYRLTKTEYERLKINH